MSFRNTQSTAGGCKCCSLKQRWRLGEENLHTDHTLVDWEEEETGVRVHFQRRDGTRLEVAGSCLIAADGIHSAARRQTHPNEGDPIYSGRILGGQFRKPHPF